MPSTDLTTVKQAFALACPDGKLLELRALNASIDGRKPCTLTGNFNEVDAAIAEIARITKASGTYFTINEIDPSNQTNVTNSLAPAKRGSTTADKDISRRVLLFIDVDPVRPAQTSATAEEHAIAQQRAQDIVEFLSLNDFEPLMVADTGNGAAIFYRIDLPADDSGLIADFLKTLDRLFSDDLAKVDTSVSNPARIAKVPGTLACKGESTADRPHRTSRLIEANENAATVTEEQLRSFVNEHQSEAPLQSIEDGFEAAEVASNINYLDGFVNKYDLDVDGPASWNERGVRYRLNQCPMCSHGGDGPFFGVTDRAALVAGCHHESCKGRWGWRDFRREVEGKAKSNHKDKSVVGYSLRPLLTPFSEIPPEEIEWLWANYIPRGALVLLNGLPGVCKSLLMLYICRLITLGLAWPDGTPCGKGDAILMASEDDAKTIISPRLRDLGVDTRRVLQLTAQKTCDKTGSKTQVSFTLQDSEVLDEALYQRPECELVILDPIASFVGRIKPREDEEVRSVLEPLVGIAAKHKVAIVAITHSRKAASDHADDLVMGSRAFSAVARAVWHLVADRYDPDRREMLCGKFNLGKRPPGWGFKINENPSGLLTLDWENDPLDRNANDPLLERAEDAATKGTSNKLEACRTWLEMELQDAAKPTDDINKRGHSIGFSKSTIERARKALDVVSFKPVNPGPWFLKLPETQPENEEQDNE